MRVRTDQRRGCTETVRCVLGGLDGIVTTFRAVAHGLYDERFAVVCDGEHGVGQGTDLSGCQLGVVTGQVAEADEWVAVTGDGVFDAEEVGKHGDPQAARRSRALAGLAQTTPSLRPSLTAML